MNEEEAKRIFNTPNDKYNKDMNAIRQVVVSLMYDVHALHVQIEELSKLMQKKGKSK